MGSWKLKQRVRESNQRRDEKCLGKVLEVGQLEPCLYHLGMGQACGWGVWGEDWEGCVVGREICERWESVRGHSWWNHEMEREGRG